MALPDLEQKYYPNRWESLPRSPWVHVSRMNFPPGSYGYVNFPKELEDRLRPKEAGSLPLVASFDQDPKMVAALDLSGVTARGMTVKDVLSLSHNYLEWAPKINCSTEKLTQIRCGIDTWFVNQTLLPHAHFISRLFSKTQPSIPDDREPELRETVEEILHAQPQILYKKFKLSSKVYLFRSFGLLDGQPVTPFQWARELDTTQNAILQFEQEIFDRLKASPNIEHLAGLLGFPHGSIGRVNFGAVFLKDLPAAFFTNKYLFEQAEGQLSLPNWVDLRHNAGITTLMDFIYANPSRFTKESTLPAIQQAITNVLKTVQETPKPKSAKKRH